MATDTVAKTIDVNTPIEDKTDFWIKHNVNVLFTGRQGVGKSTIIEDAFKRNNIKYKYFTASLLDPYLSLIGVPKEKIDKESGLSVLEYIKPREFSSDEDLGVEAIMFDEFNRASPAVRNAVMELIQFKSINGVRLPNLRFIWAAINPSDEDDTFDVFELDPAQKDRFHVQHTLENIPSNKYFTAKYGSHMAKVAIKWWKRIPDETKLHVSPRRLDYALEMYQIGGDVSDTLIGDSRPEDLVRKLQDVTGGEGTVLDKWISDPQSFINEITDRNVPYEGKVCEDFAVLKAYSVDQAVDMVGNLLPEQLREIASDPTVVDLMLRNYNGPQTESVKSAFEEACWFDQHRDYIFSQLDTKGDVEYIDAFKANDFEGMKNFKKQSGFTYMCTLMWAKDNLDEFPMELLREYYNDKPALLEFLAQWDYKLTARLFEAQV